MLQVKFKAESTKVKIFFFPIFCLIFFFFWNPGVEAITSDNSSHLKLHYLVSLKSPNQEMVQIMATLTGLDPDTTSLLWNMNDDFAFIKLPEPLLHGQLEAMSGGISLECARLSAYSWEVECSGINSMRIDLTVPLIHRSLDKIKKRDAYEFPYVTEDHGMLVPSTMFPYPKDIEVDEINVKFELPEGWRVIGPWKQLGENVFVPGGRDSLLDNLIAIGKWNVHKIQVNNFIGSIAFAPGQKKLEKAAVELIQRIVEAELKLFGLPPEGRYLFIFGRPDQRGLAGSPKKQSMTLSVSPLLLEAVKNFLPHLIAHEFYHTWVSQRFDMPDELRWVTEGFTDYYAHLVLTRIGIETWEQFSQVLSEKMSNCLLTSARGKLTLVDAGGSIFFNDKNAHDLVYEGGLLLAAWLDLAIRKQGKGNTLDDLMREFNNDPNWLYGKAKPANADFFAVSRKFAGESMASKLEQYVTSLYAFDPEEAFDEVGVKLLQRGKRFIVPIDAWKTQ